MIPPADGSSINSPSISTRTAKQNWYVGYFTSLYQEQDNNCENLQIYLRPSAHPTAYTWDFGSHFD